MQEMVTQPVLSIKRCIYLVAMKRNLTGSQMIFTHTALKQIPGNSSRQRYGGVAFSRYAPPLQTV